MKRDRIIYFASNFDQTFIKQKKKKGINKIDSRINIFYDLVETKRERNHQNSKKDLNLKCRRMNEVGGTLLPAENSSFSNLYERSS